MPGHSRTKRPEIAGGAAFRRLERWFAAAKRPMPWRLDVEPYGCWLSEIMMQQTTYQSVLPYYARFRARFPTVAALAAADEADVLKAWEGLGYYARARNLHKAAREIVRTGQPRWPASAAEWAALPGVGPYTAAALASVLAGERIPVVDGNVARVFARYWLLKDDFHGATARAALAQRLQGALEAAEVPGNLNQAMMELGALVCTPTEPTCGACPLAKECAARQKGVQAAYPVKPARKALPVRRRTAVVIRDAQGRVLLVQNRAGGLLKGLWDLPTIEADADYAQVFSHFKLEMGVYRATSSACEFRDPTSVPLTTAARKVLGLA